MDSDKPACPRTCLGRLGGGVLDQECVLHICYEGSG